MASVQPGHSQGDLRDDESLLDDDLIEADDGEFLLAMPLLPSPALNSPATC